MKIYIKLLFLLILLFTISYAQNQLKIATYNIQGMRPGTSPEIRIQHIIEKLKELDPDIIGLQEICEEKNTSDPQNQAVTIADALSSHFGTDYYIYQIKNTDEAWWGQFKQFEGMISKYPFIEKDAEVLTGGLFTVRCLYGLFDTPVGEILFFTTHLSYESAWVNETQIQETLNFVSTKRAIHSNDNAIVVGDFNTEPDRPSYPMMINGKYIDTYATINPNSNGFTAPVPGPIMRIDFIFVNSFSDLVIDDSYLFGGQPISQDFYLSDHLGILTTFSNPTYVEIMEEVTVPTTFSLSQNYPNPFNPSTIIKYNLSIIGHVSLTVHDILGNEVAELVNSEQQPGEYQMEFDGSELSNGIYFYQLKTDSFIQTKRMLLIK
jgi:endonuclease/exonuclease/phosphatase family metal-dependent hydrolase